MGGEIKGKEEGGGGVIVSVCFISLATLSSIPYYIPMHETVITCWDEKAIQQKFILYPLLFQNMSFTSIKHNRLFLYFHLSYCDRNIKSASMTMTKDQLTKGNYGSVCALFFPQTSWHKLQRCRHHMLPLT